MTVAARGFAAGPKRRWIEQTAELRSFLALIAQPGLGDAQGAEDGARRRRPVQRDEVNARCAGAEQLTALQGRPGYAQLQHRRRVVRARLQRGAKRRRYGCADLGGEA